MFSPSFFVVLGEFNSYVGIVAPVDQIERGQTVDFLSKFYFEGHDLKKYIEAFNKTHPDNKIKEFPPEGILQVR